MNFRVGSVFFYILLDNIYPSRLKNTVNTIIKSEQQMFGTMETNRPNCINKEELLNAETYNKLFSEYYIYMSNLLNNKNVKNE